MIVRKLDHTGREIWHYQAEVIRQAAHVIVIEAYFNREDVDLGYTIFRQGDRFVEYFYNDRWYNVFAVYDRSEHQFKGWYCNVCRPAVWDERIISCEDLALDVWVFPDGRTRIMDQDEFAVLPLNDVEQEQARQALAQIIDRARQNELPR